MKIRREARRRVDREVSPLAHEARNDAMEGGSLVVKRFATLSGAFLT
jgi:hypothetical protein